MSVTNVHIDRHPNGKEDENDEKIRDQKDLCGSPDIGAALPHFACQFHGRDPTKYCIQHEVVEGSKKLECRSCNGAGFANIQRLKEHFMRKHCPVQVDLCSQTFHGCDRASSILALETHQELPIQGELRELGLKEGMSDVQWAKIAEVVGKNQASSSKEEGKEKWFKLWNFLFPESKTPYYEPTFRKPTDQDTHTQLNHKISHPPAFSSPLGKPAVSVSALTSSYGSAKKNGRKALRVLMKGIEYLACPDSGSDRNIISNEFAINNKIQIRRGKSDRKMFELGDGSYVQSIGRALIPCSVARGTSPKRKQWFHVLAKCAVPLIIGRLFLEEAEILTKNQHLLERCPLEFEAISCLNFIGAPRSRSGMSISLDGRLLVAMPDTGSDLNLMSLSCAEREGFYIDRRREGLLRLQVADGSEIKTIGQVHVSSLSLDLRRNQTFSENSDVVDDSGDIDLDTNIENQTEASVETFHVIDGLPCDIILGRSFLEKTDAFNRGIQTPCYKPTKKKKAMGIKIFRILGPLQSHLIKRPAKEEGDPNEVIRTVLRDEFRAERFRRSKERRRIEELTGAEKTAAIAAEETVIKAYDQRCARRGNHESLRGGLSLGS